MKRLQGAFAAWSRAVGCRESHHPATEDQTQDWKPGPAIRYRATWPPGLNQLTSTWANEESDARPSAEMTTARVKIREPACTDCPNG